MFVAKLGLPEPLANLIRPANNRKAPGSANNKNQQHQSHQHQQQQQQLANKNPIATPPKPPIKQQQIANNNFCAELNNNSQKPATFNGQPVANNPTMTADRRNISTSTVASSGYNSQTNNHRQQQQQSSSSSSSYFSQGANNSTSDTKMAHFFAAQRQYDSYLAAEDPVALLALSHQRRRRQAIRVAAPMVPMMIDDENTTTGDLDDNNLDESDEMLRQHNRQHLHHHHNHHQQAQQLQSVGRHRQSSAGGSRRLIDDAADDGLTTSMMLDHHFIEEDDNHRDGGDDDDDDDDDHPFNDGSDDVSQFHNNNNHHHHHHHHHQQQHRMNQCADSDDLAGHFGPNGDNTDHPRDQTRNAFTTYNARHFAALQYLNQSKQLSRSSGGANKQARANLAYHQPSSFNLIEQECQSSSLLYHQPYHQQPLASLPPQEAHLNHLQPRGHVHQSSRSLTNLNKQKMQSSGSRQHLSSSPTIDAHHQHQHSKRKSGHVTNSTGFTNSNNNNNKQFKSTNNFNSNALKSSMPKSLITPSRGGGGGGGGGGGSSGGGGKNRSRSGKSKNGQDGDTRTALSCCGKLAKLLLFISNALFWLAGIALATWGILALVDDHKYNLSQLLVFEANSTGRMSLFQLLSWSFITLGCATVLVGFCGCSALFKNNRWILGLYIFLVLAIFALDLATGLLAIIFQERLVTNVRLRLVNKLRLEYGVQASFTAAIDYIQTKFECCGLDGHFDYDQSVWRLQRLGGFEATVARTCCHLRNTFDDQAHVNPRPVNESMCQSTDVRFHQSYRYRRGCLDDLEKLIRHKIWTFTIGCAAVGIVILVSLVFATCFCRSIPSKSRKNSRSSADQDDEERRQQVAVLNFPDQTTTKKQHHVYSR